MLAAPKTYLEQAVSQGWLEVEVTADDIRWSVRGSCRECPVSLAIKRRIPNCFYVISVPSPDWRVSCVWIVYKSMDSYSQWRLPVDIARRMLAFDSGKMFMPCRFTAKFICGA